MTDPDTPQQGPPRASPRADDGHPYAALLGKVEKPGRYLGGEEQSVVKPDDGSLLCRFVLAFPDLYEIGMSHLGTRILYDLINACADLACERAFSPWIDMEKALRAAGLPLISLETHRPLSEFDVVGVSLQYELSYTNVLLNLELGGVTLRASERAAHEPIVIAGGPTATHPEPLAPFIDAFLVGEAEEVLPGLLRVIGHARRRGDSRAAILAAVSRLPGVYVPHLYAVEVEPRTGLQVVTGRTPEGVAAGAPETIARAWVRDLERFPFPTRFPVPYAEAIFDRAAVEITRGCTEGCRFCQAGMIYRPVRERTPQSVLKAVLDGIDATGFDSTSLTALSTADVSCIDPLIKSLVPELAKRKVKLGVASLRAYGLSEDLIDEIGKVGIDGLTFAPEAGTQRMRDVINKNVSDEDILTSARRVFSRGHSRMKLYFIMGLPTETDEDVAGIAATGAAVLGVAKSLGLGKLPTVTVSVSQHVPKPHTPFQWAAMDAVDDLEAKVAMLRGMTKRARVQIKTHEPRESWLECLFARGDRRMGEVLLHAYRGGARFDGWGECFRFDVWLDALDAIGIEPSRYTQTLPLEVPLPWSHIDIGLEPGFLEREYRKALAGRVSPPCGKPFGAKVHARTIEEAEAESRRLVCYDCGVACDLTEMRQERIVALESLRARRERGGGSDEAASLGLARGADRMGEPDRDVDDGSRSREDGDAGDAGAHDEAIDPTLVPLDRLRGRLALSRHKEGSAFKHAAEAPYSRLRVFYGKRPPLSHLSHLDLVRMLPRMFRRARIELAFSRGFNPKPRMSFGPALPLGMQARSEALEIDVILDESADDMLGRLSDAQRVALETDVTSRLRAVAPPGLEIVGVRTVAAGEHLMGELVVGGEYVVTLPDDVDLEAIAARVAAFECDPAALLADTVGPSTDTAGPRRGRDKRRGPPTADEVREVVRGVQWTTEGGRALLRFQLLAPPGVRSVRPRELAAAIVGRAIEDRYFARTALLARVSQDDALVALHTLDRPRRPEARQRGEATWSLQSTS